MAKDERPVAWVIDGRGSCRRRALAVLAIAAVGKAFPSGVTRGLKARRTALSSVGWTSARHCEERKRRSNLLAKPSRE